MIDFVEHPQSNLPPTASGQVRLQPEGTARPAYIPMWGPDSKLPRLAV